MPKVNVGEVLATMEGVQNAPRCKRRVEINRGGKWMPAQVCTITIAPHFGGTFYHVIGTWGAEYVPLAKGPQLLRFSEDVRS